MQLPCVHRAHIASVNTYVHLVECLDHIDNDNDAHDELDDAGDDEQHAGL